MLRRIGDVDHVLQRFDNVPDDGDLFSKAHDRLQSSGGVCD
jgi:hypothetical protein